MAYSKYNLPTLDYVKFGSYHAYTRYGLICSHIEVETPKLKTKSISTFYTQGSIDVTDNISSVKHYDNRKISITFKVEEDKTEWKSIFKRVMEELHGTYQSMIYLSGYDAYYEGRVHVNKFKTSELTGEIVIDIDAKPWVMDTIYNINLSYSFDTKQIQTLDQFYPSGTYAIKEGDVAYYTGEERYILSNAFGRTTEAVSAGSNSKMWKIGSATSNFSIIPSIQVRTTKSDEAYLSKTFPVTITILRKIVGW